ncbi:MAG: hypothetical protein R6U63_07155 [Longimicrobiales bacterium]
MRNTRTVTKTTLPLLAAGLLLGACDDPTDVEEHLEASGFVVMVDGLEALRFMDADGGTPQLSLDAGAIYEIEVALLDEDGHELPADHEDSAEHEDDLLVTILDSSVATFTPEAHTGTETEEHVAIHGELETLTAGTTAVELCLDHEGHCDYENTFTLEVTTPAM